MPLVPPTMIATLPSRTFIFVFSYDFFGDGAPPVAERPQHHTATDDCDERPP